MTSNIGADKIRSIGFDNQNMRSFSSGVQAFFRPEFFNRIDTVVNFDALTQETSVEIPLELAFALRGPRPNPARTDVLIEFSVPRALPVALALYDVQGRLQSRKELGRVDPGAHTVRFGDARDLSPGVYLLQLSQGDRSLTTRLLVMR